MNLEGLAMKNPLNTLRMLKGFYLLSQNPNRLEQVFEIADSGESAQVLQEVADHVSKDPQGKRAMEEMPRVGSLDLTDLVKLAPGTLGREFADHMLRNKLDPGAIPVPDIAKDRDLRYVKAHLRETHDIWHVVTGFSTSLADELGLQAFYLAQLPGRLPSAILAAAFLNTLVYNFDERDVRMRAIVRGWLLGKRSRLLFGVRWDDYLERPLVEVQRKLGIAVAAVDAILPADEAVEILRAVG
jgi:ubiquinone biosynthesis protein COQ4